jgi:hypothetical protein
MKRYYAIITLIIILVSNLFSFLQGRVAGFMQGYRMYQACIGPLEHAIVRLHIKNGAEMVIKTWQPGGAL